jgi:hypothetical protein
MTRLSPSPRWLLLAALLLGAPACEDPNPLFSFDAGPDAGNKDGGGAGDAAKDSGGADGAAAPDGAIGADASEAGLPAADAQIDATTGDATIGDGASDGGV